MRAAVYDHFGPPEVLEIRELPDPTPRAGELVVAVRAAALNPKDVLIRKGKMWPMSGRGFPRPTGFDFALADGLDVSVSYTGDLTVDGQSHALRAGLGGQF